MKPKLEARHWLLLAAIIRIIAACTRVNWHYPDEWFQTIEFSQLLLGKTATFSHEMGLHLRNLSWPLVLTLPIWAAGHLSPHWTHLRLILCQLVSGALDLAALWAFSRLARGWAPLWRNLGFALLILPWFRVQDSVSLGAEHICVCLIWLTLAALQEKRFRMGGILAVAIFAVKYPAGLVALGFSLGILFQSLRTRTWKPLLEYLGGLAIGAILFGAADWIYYGRPWESLWMYLQYNVFTTAGIEAFGKKSLLEYWDFLQSRWLRVLFPLGMALVLSGFTSVLRDLRKLEPWALAFVAYLAGHLLVAHREPRFMFPAEALLLWGALKLAAETRARWRLTATSSVVLVIIFIANAPLFLKAAIAETGTLNSSYFEVDRRLQETANVCAVVSQRKLDALLIPGDPFADTRPVYGFFDAERRRPTFPQSKTARLSWYVHGPRCSSEDTVLLLVDRPDVGWVEAGCRLQRSGLLEILPQSLWVTSLHRGWVSGPWYACPSTVLSQFSTQTEETPFIHGLVRYQELPSLGISAQELVELGKAHSPAHQCRWTCE